MKCFRVLFILIMNVAIILFIRCKRDQIILHGEIDGLITDVNTSQPLQSVMVILSPVNDTITTGIDGTYIFKSVIPSNYQVLVSKQTYNKDIKNVTVISANISEIDFALHTIPYPDFSNRYLDFGFDSTSKFITITNKGTGKLKFWVTADQDWISVNPNSGEVTSNPEAVKVTIDRTGLSGKKHIGVVEVETQVGTDLERDTIHTFMNGVMDKDKNYYDVVNIGDQTWMAENLNTGKQILSVVPSTDNNVIEKYCYGNSKENCKIYGGLYTWSEAIQYHYSTDTINYLNVQGVCPDGWHIPGAADFIHLFSMLNNYVGGLKEEGTTHWASPNSGGTNETGFTALPAGYKKGNGITGLAFNGIGKEADFWADWPPFHPEKAANYVFLSYNNGNLGSDSTSINNTAMSVRCIKDTPGK